MDRPLPLLETAAERSRISARTRAERLMVAGRSVAQMAVAATLSWLVAVEVLGHPDGFFAPVAAIVTLGVTYGQRGRRALELTLGVTTGILIADLIVLAIGTGTLQLGLVVLLAVTAAILLGSGPILVNQAAISAALVVTIQSPSDGFAFDRFFDALAGGGVALLINALFLPADPVALLRRAATPVLGELAATLEDIAQALIDRDRAAAEQALLRARDIDSPRIYEAVDVGRMTTRYAPQRRGDRGHVALYAQAAAQIDLAVRNVRVLARGAISGVELDETMPPEIGDALRELASAVRALDAGLEDPDRGVDVRAPALRAAATATFVLERTGNMSVSIIVGQVQSTAVDLLRGSGLDYAEARQAVRSAAEEREQAALDEAPGA